LVTGFFYFITLENDAENIAELTEQAENFAGTQMPLLKALQVV